MSRKKILFPLFIFHQFSYSGGVNPSFSPLFSFFLFLFFRFSYDFLSFFVLSSFLGVGKWEGNFRYLFPLFFFFGEKQLEKMKEVLPIFLLNFLYFFLSFDPSSFQFLGKEMGNWEDKNECPKHAKRNLQEHNLFQQNQIALIWTKTFIV